METYDIVFNLVRELEKSIHVKKKTKKIDKNFFIPKSIILDKHIYEQEKSLWKDVKYKRIKICITLPEWYVKKELKFYA